MGLLHEWAEWKPTLAPFVLDADQPVLMAGRSARSLVTITSWPDAYGADDFGAPGDNRLHLGLIPQPFCGHLERASIFILLLNPGIGPTDYYGEYEVPAYRKALFETLKQHFPTDSVPFLFLDPQYAWHGGFGWWHGKLVAVIKQLARLWSVPFATARARLGKEIASIELLPYHSPSFRDRGGWLRQLRSVALAREYVQNVVIPRVERHDAIVVVTRQARAWNLREHPGVIRYSGQEARAAHLSPDSPGGRAILAHLRKRHGEGQP